MHLSSKLFVHNQVGLYQQYIKARGAIGAC